MCTWPGEVIFHRDILYKVPKHALVSPVLPRWVKCRPTGTGVYGYGSLLGNIVVRELQEGGGGTIHVLVVRIVTKIRRVLDTEIHSANCV